MNGIPIFVIYKRFLDSNIADDKEIMTLFCGTHQQADRFVGRLNDAAGPGHEYERSVDQQITTEDNADEWL